MTNYTYSPLNVAASEIRLLTLLPGPFEADICINIEVNALTQNHVPQFEALSYAWGSVESPVKIFIDRRRSSKRLLRRANVRPGATPADLRTLAVTQNLATALRYLRYRDRKRVLWVDAICVNQKNLLERSHQVARMADIFSLASRVIVWLGPESDDSALALKSLRDVGSGVKVDWDKWQYQAAKASGDLDTLTSHFDNATWTSIFSLLSRPWFSRLWIWQEVHLAKEGAHLLCGYDNIMWSTFCNGVLFLDSKSKPATSQDPYGWKYMERAANLSIPNGQLILKQALARTRHSECADGKDKVYAVLNLVNKSARMRLEPDYSKPAYEVYQDVVLSHLKVYRNLDILEFCEMREPIAAKPTWIPDFSSPSTSSLLLCSAVAARSKTHGEYVGNGILRAAGRCATSTDHVEDIVLSENPGNQEIAETVKKLAALVIKSDEYVGGGTMIDALCRTLCCNELSDFFEPPSSYYPNESASRDLLFDLLNNKDGVTSESYSKNRNYVELVAATLYERSFLVTNDGYIGLAPRTIEPGDQICVVLGCYSLLILRPNNYGRHSVVGTCYVHGLVDGATLLGPLPSKWQWVYRFDATTRLPYHAFRNRETFKIQIEDPRLGLLPKGWQICSHEYKTAYNMYLNLETGERTSVDPRVSLEALRARGVELQDFWLM